MFQLQKLIKIIITNYSSTVYAVVAQPVPCSFVTQAAHSAVTPCPHPVATPGDKKNGMVWNLQKWTISEQIYCSSIEFWRGRWVFQGSGSVAVLKLHENHAQVFRMSPRTWLSVVGIYMEFQPRIAGFSTQKSTFLHLKRLHYRKEGKPQCGSVRKESKKKKMWIDRLKLHRVQQCWLPGRSRVPHLLKGGEC